MERVRFRQLGFKVGELEPGPYNAITDVPGVRVGHFTLIRGDGRLIPGKGPVRTGVTVILPHGGNLFADKVRAAVHTINGYGKPAGFEQVRELGELESPIALTNTLNVGLVMDALVEHAIRTNPEIGIRTSSVNVVVGETNDGYLNDLQGRHVRREHVLEAIETAAGGAVAEGAVGAGTGTVCMGWKGGIGTASRVWIEGDERAHLGVLAQTNFGRASDLTVLGVPVGRWLLPGQSRPGFEHGSVVVVIATDINLPARQLQRLCVRAAAGLARTGSQYSHGSGDFVIAFSTGQQQRSLLPESGSEDPQRIDSLFRAVVECVEEAVLNSLTMAQTIIGRDQNSALALPLDQLVELLESGKAVFR